MIMANALRSGSIFEYDNRKYVVLKYQHIKKGRGQATIRVKVRDIESQVITEKTFTNEQSVSEADVQKKTAQFLYSDDRFAYFMDTDDYSQYELEKEQLETELNFLTDGMKVITLYIDGKAASIELPKSVELVIAETEPAIAGNTATGAVKNAKLETGFVVKVPLFLKTGDKIRINTETGAYKERVN
jgi:elongation factor P